MNKLIKYYILLQTIIGMNSCNALEVQCDYILPPEDSIHEGTWLQWPHDKTYGNGTRNELEPVWIAMTEALSSSEMVHIIAYDDLEKQHIDAMLKKSKTDMSRINYYLFQTDDTWVRDNGPIFVFDKNGQLTISDWKFNGWGKKCPFQKDDLIPSLIGKLAGFPVVKIDMVLEGGSIETDGNGTCIATLSSIVNPNRNPKMKRNDIEKYLTRYLGFNNYIWLKGVSGLEVTDFHIDGFVKMIDDKILLTLSESDLLNGWAVPEEDVTKILSAKNSKGRKYDIKTVPLTSSNVEGVDFKGSYLNYYIANTVVLIPNYNDSNDRIANEIIAQFYPNRKVIGIDVRKLYKYGGMVHCVTQQQPASISK